MMIIGAVGLFCFQGINKSNESKPLKEEVVIVGQPFDVRNTANQMLKKGYTVKQSCYGGQVSWAHTGYVVMVLQKN